jgi:drug/metabolite transporter (DMT)-like permease
VLCVSWGFNQVAVKLALPEIPPLVQAAFRSTTGTLLLLVWMRLRGVNLTARDGSLVPGLSAGLLFGLEFLLIYRGLALTSASRASLFLYTAPFFVVIGAAGVFRAIVSGVRNGPDCCCLLPGSSWLSVCRRPAAIGARSPAI